MNKVTGNPEAGPTNPDEGNRLFLKGMACGPSSKISPFSPSRGVQGHWKEWCVCKGSDMWKGRVCSGLERSWLWLSWAVLLGMEDAVGPQRVLNAKAKCLSALKSGSSLGRRHGGEGSCLKGGAVLSPDCQMSGEARISPTFLQCLSTQSENNN